MKNKKLLISSLILVVTFTLGMSTFSYATTVSEKQGELSEINKQKDAASADIETIKGKLAEQQKEVDKVNDQVSKKESEIAEMENKVAETKKSMDARKEGLDNRLRAMYKNGSVGFVDILLSSKDVSEFLSNMEMIKKIYAYDESALSQLKKDHEYLEKTEKELVAQKDELLVKQKEAKEKTDQFEKERSATQAKFDSLTQESANIGSQIAALQAAAESSNSGGSSGGGGGGYTVGSGVLVWPASGPITSPFGPREHPVFGSASFHTGIDIGASYGSPIVAADSGTVIMAGWYGGYGQCVVINHGGGIATLYAHASSINVSTGQSVSQGETIAYVGSTGWSTGPHLHFEVQVNGNAVNPMGYL